jgi:conjugal transfer pilus assembly protein TraK
MQKIKRQLTVLIMAGLVLSSAAHCATSAFLPGRLMTLQVSHSSPNLIIPDGDRITAISSASGVLADSRNTRDGGVIFSTSVRTPFTLYLETEKSGVTAVQAIPVAGEGRVWRLRDTRVNPVTATAQPYEAALVALNRSLLMQKIPQGWSPAKVQTGSLPAPSGLRVVAEDAWQGDGLRIVRARVQNNSSTAVVLNERDFYAPGVRALMLSGRVRELPPGGSATLHITLTEAVHEQPE